jgi:chemotaxis protein histidine kinase CheA
MAEEVDIDVNVNTNADEAEGKLGSLKSQIRETVTAMQKLELQGKATGAEYEKLRDKLDGLNDAQDRAKFKAGQFEDRLASLPGPLGKLGSGIKAAGDSFATFGTTLTVSLGIVGLLVTAFFAIKEALSKTKEGTELLSKATSAFNAVIAPLLAIFEKLGTIVLPILTKGLEAVGSVMNKVAKFFGVADSKIKETTASLEENNEAAKKLSEAEKKRVEDLKKLQDEKDKKAKEIADKEAARKKAEKAARDAEKKELDEGQKEAMKTLLSDQEKEIFTTQEKYAKLIFLATKYKEDTTQIKDAQAKELAAIDKKYADAEAERSKKSAQEKQDFEDKLAKDLEKIAEEKKKKDEEDAQKKFDAESQARVDAANLVMADYNYKKALGDATFQDELVAFDRTRQLEREDMMARRVSADALLAFDKETSAARTEIERAQQEIKLGIISNALGTIAEAVGQNTVAGKALAVAQATIDTYTGATKALATYPPPFGAIAAGTVVLAGLLNIKKIVSTQIPKLPGAKGGGGSVSTPSIALPTIPTVQAPQIQTGTGINATSQIAQTIGAAQKPIEAYVVSQKVSSQQALDRRTNRAAIFTAG